MKRRTFLAGSAAVPAILAPKRRQPNVLFVLTDEWRAQATGYSGDPNVLTPALDAFAQESVNFVNAVSGNPVCCPYRGSLMTGQYPLTNGVIVNDQEFKPPGITLGQAFADAGYETAYIGKWHLYGSPGGHYERRSAYIPPELRFGFHYWKTCECTHEYNSSRYYEGDNPEAKTWPTYDAIAQTEDACRFIQQRSRSRTPFFLVLSLGPPHFPLDTAPEEYRALYRDRAIQLRPNVPEQLREKTTADLRGYYAHMSALNYCMSRLLRTVAGAGITDRTIVVFTSDHGDMMGSQGLNRKGVPWDESIRVPFLLRYPGGLGTKGRQIPTPLNTPDIMPTLLRLAELPVPDGVQGENYSALCRGGRAPAEAAALLQFPVSFGQTRRQGIGEYRGLRTRQHTYVRSIHGPWLLYDNQADPFQMRNLCGRSEHRETLARLDRMLEARLKTSGDDFRPAEEYVARAGVGHYGEVSVKPGHSRSPWGDWASTL